MCDRNGTRTVLERPNESQKWSWIYPSTCSLGLWTFQISILIWIIAGSGRGYVVPQPRLGNMSSSSVSLAVNFLSKYGYLPQSDLQTSNLRTEDRLQEAIWTMQKFGNIPQTGVVDNATLKLMKTKRCGVPDLIGISERVKRYALQGQRWSGTNLTWSVKEPVSKTNVSMVRGQLAKAFAVWADASILTFTEIRGTKADILVSFLHGSHGDGYPFDGEGSVLAHAFFPGEGIGGDAHFDAEERWLPQQPLQDEDGVNLFAVAAHEIGHSLGLSHSSTPGSLMFPYYQVVDGHFRLPEDDINGIQQLYGPKTEKKWATMPDEYPTAPVKTTTTKKTTIKSTTTTAKRTKWTPRKPKTSTTPYVSKEKTVTTILPTTNDDYSPSPPDPCNTTIDAISVIRREVFLFKDEYFWRLNINKTLKRGYPAPVNRFWHELPKNIKRIDAVYERPYDTKIVFFTGKQYWLFIANELVKGYPHPITDLGLPSDLEKIDAALVWGHNGKTYLFSRSHYWKLDENDGTVELDYPRDINAWRGIPRDLDAAFQGVNGYTYFFKNKRYWKFNDLKMKVHEIGDASELWFGCQQGSSQKLFTSNVTEAPTVLQNSEYNGQKKLNHFNVVILLIFTLVYFTSNSF